MTSLERETQIRQHGASMMAAYARYERSGCFADRGEADAHRINMEAAIAKREAADVAFIEQSRGIN
jgi:hypothetical protein